MSENSTGSPSSGSANQEQRLVTYIISPPVRAEMDRAGQDGRVAIIISPSEDRQHPDCGVTTSIKVLKEYLGAIEGANVRDSDYYVFATLRPVEIEELAR